MVDMRSFFERRFADIASQYSYLHSWPGAPIIQQLTDRAAGDVIDQLYEQTLRYSFLGQIQVIGAIVLAKTLLHRDGLEHFFERHLHADH
jgi:hypothetical protein